MSCVQTFDWWCTTQIITQPSTVRCVWLVFSPASFSQSSACCACASLHWLIGHHSHRETGWSISLAELIAYSGVHAAVGLMKFTAHVCLKRRFIDFFWLFFLRYFVLIFLAHCIMCSRRMVDVAKTRIHALKWGVEKYQATTIAMYFRILFFNIHKASVSIYISQNWNICSITKVTFMTRTAALPFWINTGSLMN